MNTEARYDVVLEMHHPNGESSEVAYETWGRSTRVLVRKLLKGYPGVTWCRVARAGDVLKVSFRADSLRYAGRAAMFLLTALAVRASTDLTVRFHECPPICIEREQDDAQQVECTCV